jgi:hypothetical protein
MEAEWRISVCVFDAVGMEGKMRKVLSKEEEDNVYPMLNYKFYLVLYI